MCPIIRAAASPLSGKSPPSRYAPSRKFASEEIVCRATALNAIPCVDSRCAEAKTIDEWTRSGNASAHSIACCPPRPSAGDGQELADPQVVDQPDLELDPIADGDDGEGHAVRLPVAGSTLAGPVVP